jgi:hypothetical protein
MLWRRRCTTIRGRHPLLLPTRVPTSHHQEQGYPHTPTTQEQYQARCQVSTLACQVSHSSCPQATPTQLLLQQRSKLLLSKPLLLLHRLQLPLPQQPRSVALAQTSVQR